jgi:16S rRNA (cytidine1402-2'-O)-methyltransferase
MPGKLYLIPSMIGETRFEQVIPAIIKEIINRIRHYIVEDERTARRTLIKLGIQIPIDELRFYLLNKHTHSAEIPSYLAITENEDMGLLSEAGVPAIADPGKEIVLLAHERNIEVVPLVGPSSILLAMMASGLNGQNFAFNGYLPVKPAERIQKLKLLEKRSQAEDQSQLFIETPYRNNTLLKDIIATCSEGTLLCIAANITSPDAFILTQSISAWRKMSLDLTKQPAIFIIHGRKTGIR